MYKIVSITALTTANSFISSDKIIEISQNRTKMFVGENDYEHKNKFYLSTCIENSDRSLNAYISAYDSLSNTYITSSLSDVYITNGNLVTRQTVDKILSSEAYLTKDGCKSFETECIAYINELKNKAVSIIMAKLNESFINQNSVKRPIYGQTSNGEKFKYTKTILKSETYPDYSSNGSNSFDFEKGEFTLAKLLFNKFERVVGPQGPSPGHDDPDPGETTTTRLTYYDLYLNNWDEVMNSYYLNDDFGSADAIIEDDKSDNARDSYLFNAADQTNYDFKIKVPPTSFDYKNNQSIPIAKLITYVLKKQIYRSLTNICNNYASLMISVPKKP